MNVAAAWVAVLLYIGAGVPRWQQWAVRVANRLGDALVLVLAVPFVLATNLQPAPIDLLRLVAYLGLPTLLLRAGARWVRLRGVCRVAAILSLWVPIEPDLFALALDLMPAVGSGALLARVAALPRVDAVLVPGVALPIRTLTAVHLALWLFVIRYPLAPMGLTWRLDWSDAGNALLGLAAFAVVGLPIGLSTGFLRYNPVFPSVGEALMRALGGYLLVALPEEVLFRGVIQNLLSKSMTPTALALLVAAVVFGLAHLNNATAGFAEPNWTYALMASVAGLAYGWVWRRTGKVSASALTHAAVNLIWSIAFH